MACVCPVRLPCPIHCVRARKTEPRHAGLTRFALCAFFGRNRTAMPTSLCASPCPVPGGFWAPIMATEPTPFTARLWIPCIRSECAWYLQWKLKISGFALGSFVRYGLVRTCCLPSGIYPRLLCPNLWITLMERHPALIRLGFLIGACLLGRLTRRIQLTLLLHPALRKQQQQRMARLHSSR